jgi:CHAT domain-containing protein
MFSALAFHDGPLTVHDLDALDAAPRLVFLSSCDVGRAEVTAGHDAVGVVAALLDLGTATLVASVLPVPDTLAAALAGRFHAALADGVLPAAALAGAAEGGELSPFIAFGAG